VNNAVVIVTVDSKAAVSATRPIWKSALTVGSPATRTSNDSSSPVVHEPEIPCKRARLPAPMLTTSLHILSFRYLPSCPKPPAYACV
jgi:hypothetical protein